jgi:hypothetical protein
MYRCEKKSFASIAFNKTDVILPRFLLRNTHSNYIMVFSLHFSCCILCVDIFCRVQFIAESLSTRGFFLLLCILQEENCCIPELEF